MSVKGLVRLVLATLTASFFVVAGSAHAAKECSAVKKQAECKDGCAWDAKKKACAKATTAKGKPAAAATKGASDKKGKAAAAPTPAKAEAKKPAKAELKKAAEKKPAPKPAPVEEAPVDDLPVDEDMTGDEDF